MVAHDAAHPAELAEVLGRAADLAGGHAPLGAAVEGLARLSRTPVPAARVTGRGSDEPASPLTPREVAVLDLVVQGRTNSEIGAVLHISPKTAGAHVSNILHKIGARSRAQAAALAVRMGLTDRPAPPGDSTQDRAARFG